MKSFPTNSNSIYQNSGNAPLLSAVPAHINDVLDVGCGAGGNSKRMSLLYPNLNTTGITLSQSEAEKARAVMNEVYVADLEKTDFKYLGNRMYDLIVLSHVLEHLTNPSQTLVSLSRFVKPGGHFLIAVPNVVAWRNRMRIACGGFDYKDGGVMDRTHLRFFTWNSAPALLLGELEGFSLQKRVSDGSAPLWFLRRLLPKRATKIIDRSAGKMFPNLFSSQIIMLVERKA